MDFQTYKREMRELNDSFLFVDYNSLEKWGGLLKELKKDAYSKWDKCQFMECVCEFIEFLANFVSHLNDLREETFVCRKSFNIIKELVNPNLEKVFLICCTHTILAHIIEENIKNWCMKRELLQLLLNFIEKTDANNLKTIVNHLEHHLIFKLVDQIGSCGNYPSQLLILKTIFYIYGKDEVDSKLNELLPESQELSQGLADITLNTFHEDSRRFLNTFNERENNTQIFSIYCQNVQMEDKLIEQFESWIDFNIKKEIISWHCIKNQLIPSEKVDNDKFVLITFFISDISKFGHQLENTEYVVWFTLKAPCISDDEEVEEVIKNWKRFLFAFKVTDKSTYFIDNILPKISTIKKKVFSEEAVSEQIVSPFVSTSPTTYRSDIGSSITTISATADFLSDGLLSAEKDISQIKMFKQRMEEIGVTEHITNFVYQRNGNPEKNSSKVTCFKLKDNRDLSEKLPYSAVLESKGSGYGSVEKIQIEEDTAVEEIEKSCNDKQSESSYVATSVFSCTDFLTTNENEYESDLITSDLSTNGFTNSEDTNNNDEHSEENLSETIHQDFSDQYDDDDHLRLSYSKTNSSLQLLDELDALFDASTQKIKDTSSMEDEIDLNEITYIEECTEKNIENRDSPTNENKKGSQNDHSETKNKKSKLSDDSIKKKNEKGKIAMDIVAKHKETAEQIIDLTISSDDESEKLEESSKKKLERLSKDKSYVREQNDTETNKSEEQLPIHFSANQNDHAIATERQSISNENEGMSSNIKAITELEGDLKKNENVRDTTVMNMLVEYEETVLEIIDLTGDEVSLDSKSKELEMQNKYVINTEVNEDTLNNESSVSRVEVKRNDSEKDNDNLDASNKSGKKRMRKDKLVPWNDEQIRFEYKSNLNKEKNDNTKGAVPTDGSKLDLAVLDEENLQTDNFIKFHGAEILCSEIQEERLNNVEEINQTPKQVTVLTTEDNNEIDTTANDIEMSTNDNNDTRVIECKERSELMSKELQCQDVEIDASVSKYDNDASLTPKMKHERDVEEESSIITNTVKRRKNDLIAENKEIIEKINLISDDEIPSNVERLEVPHEHILHTENTNQTTKYEAMPIQLKVDIKKVINKCQRPNRKRRRSSIIQDGIKSPERKKCLRKSKEFEEMKEKKDETGKKNVNDEQDLISEINSSIQVQKKREGNSQLSDNIKIDKIGNDENLKNPTIKKDKKRKIRKKIFIEEPDKIYYESDHASQENSIIVLKENCKSLANVADNKSKDNESLSCEIKEQQNTHLKPKKLKEDKLKNEKTKLSNIDKMVCESELNQSQHASVVKDLSVLDSESMLKNDGKPEETSKKFTSDLQVLNNKISDKTKKINIISVINLKDLNTVQNGTEMLSEPRDENQKSLSETEASAEDTETTELIECQNQSNHSINIDHSKNEMETDKKELLEKSDVRSKDSFGENVINENQTNIRDVTNEVTKTIVINENILPKKRRLYHPDDFLEHYPEHTVVKPKSKMITASERKSVVKSKKTMQTRLVSMNKSKYSKNNISETYCWKKQHELEQETNICLKYLKLVKLEKINLKIRSLLHFFRKSVKEAVMKTAKARSSKGNISLFIERRKEIDEGDYNKNKTC